VFRTLTLAVNVQYDGSQHPKRRALAAFRSYLNSEGAKVLLRYCCRGDRRSMLARDGVGAAS
jgi:hypothetical protein